MVDVAEADDGHHALAGEQGVEEGARLGEVEVLIFVYVYIYVCHIFIRWGGSMVSAFQAG